MPEIVDGRGGARAGAGRPKLEATKFREALIRKIEERADGLADALLDKAMTGDVPALREVADRGLGKAEQSVDHKTNGKDIPTPILYGVPYVPPSEAENVE